MSDTIPGENLRAIADIITGDAPYFGKIYEAVRVLNRMFLNDGNISADGEVQPGTPLRTGYALSPEEAAKCMYDLARLRCFSRGLIQAIGEKLTAQPKRPVKILYAGCGPFAILAILAANYFSESEIAFTVVDIHERSTENVKKIVDGFGLQNYFANIICADALEFIPPDGDRPDILVIEVMQHALQREPQVSLAAHLVPLLAEGGVMIPENISVVPAFAEVNIRAAAMKGNDCSVFSAPPIFECETLAELNLATAAKIGERNKFPFAEKTIFFDEVFLRSNYIFELCTVVRVWKDEVIKLFDSGISLPLMISAGGKLSGKEGIKFKFLNVAEPRFDWEIF